MKKSIILSFALSMTIFGCSGRGFGPPPSPIVTISSEPILSYDYDNGPDIYYNYPDFPPPTPIPLDYDGTIRLKENMYNFNSISMNSSGDYIYPYSIVSKNIQPITDNRNSLLIDNYAQISNKTQELQLKNNSSIISIAIDNQRNFIVLYRETSGNSVKETVNQEITTVLYKEKSRFFIVKYDENSKPLSEEITINNTEKFSADYSYKITMTQDSDFFVEGILLKRDERANYTEEKEIFLQKFSPSLKPISDIATVKVNLSDTNPNLQSKIDKEGNYYVSYEKNGHIGLIKFDQNGKFLFNNPDLATGDIIYKCHNIIFDNNNQLILTWIKENGFRYLFIRKYSSDLKSFKQESIEENGFRSNLFIPSLSVDSKNTLTVGWLSQDKYNLESNAFIRKYDNDFKPLGDRIQINSISPDENRIYISNDLNDNLYVFFSSNQSTYLKKYDKNVSLIRP